MKQLKLIGLFIVCLLFSSTIKAESDTTKVTSSTIYHDVKEGIDKNAPKISKAIETIGKDLKVTADKVWDILVKQQKVWSICFLLLTISALTNWYLFYKNNFIKLKNGNYKIGTKQTKIRNPNYTGNSYSNEPRMIEGDIEEMLIPLFTQTNINWFKYLHLVLCLVLSIFSYLHFADMLTGFINPEYGAMKTIAEVANSLK